MSDNNLVVVIMDGIYLVGLNEQMQAMGMRFEPLSPGAARRVMKDLPVYKLGHPVVPPIPKKRTR